MMNFIGRGLNMPLTNFNDGDTGLSIRTNLNTALDNISKNNYTASSTPTVTDDSSEGYDELSMWLNASTSTLYQCLDATVDTAVWKQLYPILMDDNIIKKTDSFTLALINNGKHIEVSHADSKNVTVPPNSSVLFPIGSEIVIEKTGAGNVVIVVGSGVTINAADSYLTLSTQYKKGTLKKKLINTWTFYGGET